MREKSLQRCGAAALLALMGYAVLVATARAQSAAYPNKPIRLIVGLVAGGGADRVSRVLTRKLSDSMGQQMIVDMGAGRFDRLRTGRFDRLSRPLATGSEKRLPTIPNVPTIIESGYPQMTTSVWFGLLAQAATPAQIVTRINADVARVIAMPEVRNRLMADGQEPGGGSPDDFGRFIRSEIAKYAKVVKAAGIRGE